jgi:Membrane protein involved in the export of O-antigen and teichoic acid
LQNATENTSKGFISSILKFSISTYINFIIYGATLLLVGRLIPDNIYGPVNTFADLSITVMNIAILGLDQSFIRFFHEPPEGISKKGLFGVCFTFACGALTVLSVLGCVIFPKWLLGVLRIEIAFNYLPLLFLNALFLMVSRFYNVAYRMEQNIFMFTVQSVLSQFFSKLFYLLGFFADDPKSGMLYATVLGMGLFSLVFTLIRRKEILPTKQSFSPSVLKNILPYGLALAPSAVLIYANSAFSKVFLGATLTASAQGIFGYAAALSNIVTVVQGGFATFWGAYVFANYKTEQKRIASVHNYLNLIILCFFTCIVMFQDLLFMLLPMYAQAKYIFPVMMLSAVFAILGEGTVYGIQIARKPIFDTIGIALSLAVNIVCCVWLVPHFELLGAAMALALSGFVMFAFRTVVAQKFYKTVESPVKTCIALLVCNITAYFGYIFASNFYTKALVCLGAIGIYCLLYKAELVSCITIGWQTIGSFIKKNKATK